jgi:D-sedoheptulose 7-phosphate isomerase
MDVKNMFINDRANNFARIVEGAICTDSRQFVVDLELSMSSIMDTLSMVRNGRHALYVVGNGGSAAVASHALVDFMNVAKINTHVLHESSLVTCMANDFGYENVYSNVLSEHLKPQDVLIAISSSGNSQNICNAVKTANKIGSKTITLSGFRADNELRQLGGTNLWLDSSDYGFVEVGHQFILHNLSDRFGLADQKTKTIGSEKESAYTI